MPAGPASIEPLLHDRLGCTRHDSAAASGTPQADTDAPGTVGKVGGMDPEPEAHQVARPFGMSPVGE